MIYGIVGTDEKKRKKAYEKIIGGFDGQNFPMNKFGVSELDMIDELANSVGLFFEKHISVFEYALEKKEHAELLLNKINILKNSPNIFVFVEQTLLKETSEAFAEHAEKFEVFDIPREKYKGFNVFNLSDAFCNKDKKSLWILYQIALRENIAVEEILHKLFWQVKMLLIAKSNPNEDQLKKLMIKEYPFSKSKTSAKNFTEAELKNFSFDLVSILHDGRRGRETTVALEKFLINAF